MPSTASSSLRLQKMATGEKLNTWGSELNSTVFELLEDAIAGWETHTVTGNFTLTSTNYATDQARMAMLNLEAGGGLAAAFQVTTTATSKWYFVRNATSYNATITAGGTGAIVYPGETVAILCDGTDMYRQEISRLGQILNAGGFRIENLGAPTADAHAATKKYVDDENTAQNAAISASETAAAASAAAAATSETNAATSETNAATSATNAAASETAAAASETAAAASESAAATSETNAASSASAASTSETNASTSATAAAASASAASTSETNAASSASAASTSETNAATSETNASTSATAAAASATAAAASYDSFDDRYLGAKASDPTVDNDGNALLTGALYWNTTSNKLFWYSGSSWIGYGTMSTQDANSVAITGGTIAGITDLAVADGGTGASTASGARTNLGLGSIATQAANNVSVTGGTITGVDLTADSADLSAFSGDLSAIVGFTPVGVSYYDDTPYEAIIRKGEPERSYYTEALNTATRGSRKEFPLRGAVAWSATQVAIVDMEGGQPEMWMVFNTGRDPANAEWGIPTNMLGTGDYVINDANINKGVLYVGEDRLSGSSPTFVVGLITIDFLADRSIAFGLNSATAGQGGQQEWQGNIAERNEEKVHVKISDTGLVNSNVNAVAISGPLDHYPLDEYGRPAFAIACATDGGVSVILPDADNRGKRVTDSAVTGAIFDVYWSDYGLAFLDRSNFRAASLAAIEAGDGWSNTLSLNHVGSSPVLPNLTAGEGVHLGDETHALSRSDLANQKLVFLQRQAIDQTGSLTALLSSTALSGWMPGDCKLALDFNAYAAGSVAASTPLDDDLTSYANKAAAESDGWSDLGSGSFAVSANGLEVTTSSFLGASKAITCVAGDTYSIEVKIAAASAAAGRIYINDTNNASSPELNQTSLLAGNTYVFTFVAAASTMYVLPSTAADATTATFESITIKRAYPDLSPANNGAIINGTLVPAAVETGADLFALSGWGNANYLEVPYSSDFDMGTGDFAFLSWIKVAATTDAGAVVRFANWTGSAWSGSAIALDITSDQYAQFRITDDAFASVDQVVGSTALDDDQPHLLAAVRRGGRIELWVDGVLIGSTAIVGALASLSNTSATLRIGQSQASFLGFPGSIALPRITKGYAPTPEQIRKMYRDEKKLFEASAKCLLPSDTVNSLDARDGLLAIGTEGGAVIHDVFKRLELLDSGDIGLTESGVDSVALLGGNDVALITGSDVVARRAARDLAHPQVIDAYRYERAFSGKGYTTDATPTDIAKFPLAEGERVELRISVDTGADDGTEYGTYTRVVRARRDINGNVTVTGTDTLGTDDETTAGMDVAFAADTTAQTVDLQVTGVASTNMQWSYEAVLTLNKVV